MNEYIARLRECLRDGSNDPQSPEHWRVWLGKILSDMEKAKAMAEAGLVEYASWLEGHINTCDAGDSDGRAMLKMCLHKFTTKILSHHPTPEPTDRGEDGLREALMKEISNWKNDETERDFMPSDYRGAVEAIMARHPAKAEEPLVCPRCGSTKNTKVVWCNIEECMKPQKYMECDEDAFLCECGAIIRPGPHIVGNGLPDKEEI